MIFINAKKCVVKKYVQRYGIWTLTRKMTSFRNPEKVFVL